MSKSETKTAFSGSFRRQYTDLGRVLCVCCLKVEQVSQDVRNDEAYCVTCWNSGCANSSPPRCGVGYEHSQLLEPLTLLQRKAGCQWHGIRRVVWHPLDDKLSEHPLLEWEHVDTPGDRKLFLHWGATAGGLLVLTGRTTQEADPDGWRCVLPLTPIQAVTGAISLTHVFTRFTPSLWLDQATSHPLYYGVMPDVIKTLQSDEEWAPWLYSHPADLALRARAAHLWSRAFAPANDDVSYTQAIPMDWPRRDEILSAILPLGTEIDPPTGLAARIGETLDLVELYRAGGKGRPSVLTQTHDLLTAARAQVLARLTL